MVRVETPPLFRFMRGSSNGVLIAGAAHEVWFITHIVSHEDRRHYYHCIVALDCASCAVLRYTPPFTFEGEKVEYSLGFSHDETSGTLLVGYSTMDRCARYATVSKAAVEAMMVSA